MEGETGRRTGRQTDTPTQVLIALYHITSYHIIPTKGTLEACKVGIQYTESAVNNINNLLGIELSLVL